MKTISLVVSGFLLMSATSYSQPKWDAYITSLQMPCYPPLARQARIQGIVRVKLTVAGDGSVASAEAVEGNPVLSRAAVANVQTWKFGTTEQQQPEPTIVVFDYKLERRAGWQRCAAHVVFDSFSRVTVVSNFTPLMD
jgi:TonB family protein